MAILEIHLRGLLSFGPDSGPLALEPLNVLVGTNGSGKSNLVESIQLFRSTPTGLERAFRSHGGDSRDFLWKGMQPGVAELGVLLGTTGEAPPLYHSLTLAEHGHGCALVGEWIQCRKHSGPTEGREFLYSFDGREGSLLGRDGSWLTLRREDISPYDSILSQRRLPEQYPDLARLADHYASTRIYREWQFGRTSLFRRPQQADMPGDRLEEDFSNLGLFLNHLREYPQAKKAVIEHLRDLYAGLDDFDVRVRGGTVEVFVTEGDFTIPAGRLSDGTLRYLCLLAILCDPEPPPLICIEEPELGLHPDIIPKVADLLVEASERTQLVVSTHSDILVDALSETPESVVVVEKVDGSTTMRRLDKIELAVWLDKYRLGQLWLDGQIGGTRW